VFSLTLRVLFYTLLVKFTEAVKAPTDSDGVNIGMCQRTPTL